MAERTRELTGKFSVYGVFWARFLAWAVECCPLFLEPFYLFVYNSIFWLIAGPQRRAVQENLRVLLPGSSRLGNLFRSYLVFWNFACTLTDAARVRAGQDIITWEICGIDNFRQIADSTQGSLILTAHMGNYDIAAPVFSSKFNRCVHAVRAPEQNADLQDYNRKLLEENLSDSFKIHYNSDGAMLGVELSKALQNNDVVAIQGDRILFDVSPVSVEVDGHDWNLPLGPFFLAMTNRVPVFPLFVTRVGSRRYRVQIEPPFECRPKRRQDRERVMREAASNWSKVLGPFVRENWSQWFVFEPAFKTRAAEV